LYLSILTLFQLLELRITDIRWLNYPGLELWKFIDLGLFIVAVFLLHRRFGHPVREALRSRREVIKRELQKAQQELEEARAKLVEGESRLERLDEEIARIRERALAEAEAERERLKAATEDEIARLREQARREIESAGKAARHEVRKFAAQESVRLAEEILVRELKPEDDLRLTSLSIGELGRRPS
jgi:F-type H+-transporting ATPase subunit b